MSALLSTQNQHAQKNKTLEKTRQTAAVERKENGIVHMSVEGSLDLLRSRNMGIKSNEIQRDENFLLICITKFLVKNRVKKIELKIVFKDPIRNYLILSQSLLLT